MPQGKLCTIGRGSVHRKDLVTGLGRDLFNQKATTNRKCVGNTALFRFRSKHKNLPIGRKSASEGVHVRATYPIVVRDEDARFSCFLHVI